MGDGVIPRDWLGEYCCYSVQWPNSPMWKAVLRNVLIIPSRGRYWEEDTGVITEAQEVIKATFDYNTDLKESIMSCGDEGFAILAAAINNLANRQCCGSGGGGSGSGSGGAGFDEVPLNPITQAEIEADPTLAGFEDVEEFTNDKCAVAADIASKLSQDLGEMAITNITNMSLGGVAALLAITLATPIPVANLVAIAGLLLAIGAEIVIATSLSVVNENQQDLYCELFNGTSAADSKAKFLAKFSLLMDETIADPVTKFACLALMTYMCNPSVVNRLYYKDLTRIWTGGDCSGCGEEVCCYDFLEDTQGFVWSTLYPDWGETESTGTVTWLEAGRVELHANAEPSPTYMVIYNEDFDCVVPDDATSFVVNFEQMGTVASMYLKIRVNDVWTERFAANVGNTTMTLSDDITDIQGETIQAVAIMVSKATASGLTTVFTSMGIGC